MTLLDTLVQLSVIDKDLTTPPGSPTEGDTYIVATGGTGAWIGWDKRIARFIDGTWRSYLPGASEGAGWLAWVMDEDAMYRFDGTNWELAGIEGPAGPEGPEGPQGDPGPAGATGADGSDPGILLTWDDDNADSDPGAGDIKADNDAFGAATKLYVSKTSRGGSNIAAFLFALDDSTNPSRKGGLILTRTADEVQAGFDVDAVTDASGYVKIDVSGHAGAAGFVAADPISFQFARDGDKGADGAGAGDVVGPAGATDGRFALFDGATGKLIKEHTGAPGALAVEDSIAPGIHAASAKATPVNDDELALIDSAASNILKKLTWANLKAALGALAFLNVENQALSGGATVTDKDLGTQSSGTLTLDLGDRPIQKYTNNGAHTLAPGTVHGLAVIDITNAASAGAITTSGWTKVAGDAFTTTNGHKFRCHASVGDLGSLLIVQAMQ